MDNPLVSICIPTYNGAAFIAEAMDSAIQQTYPNLEIVVSDDASSDNTLSIIKDYIPKTKIPISVYKHTPSGIGANWNNCIRKANGTYIKFLFQDDVLYSDCITKMVKVFEQNTYLGLVACKRDFIIAKNYMNEEIQLWMEKYNDLQATLELEEKDSFSIITKKIFNSLNFLGSPLNKIGEPSVVLFRKDTIHEIGYFDERFKQILDYEYWYRILKYKDIAIINENLVSFRLHATQATNINRKKSISDYDLYHEILYKGYFKLLHPKTQKILKKKYSFGFKLYKWSVKMKKRIIRRIKNG